MPSSSCTMCRSPSTRCAARSSRSPPPPPSLPPSPLATRRRRGRPEAHARRAWAAASAATASCAAPWRRSLHAHPPMQSAASQMAGPSASWEGRCGGAATIAPRLLPELAWPARSRAAVRARGRARGRALLCCQPRASPAPPRPGSSAPRPPCSYPM
eukprot:scaffold92780_cov58-Phaeocystis_antarctica.AAC.1